MLDTLPLYQRLITSPAGCRWINQAGDFKEMLTRLTSSWELPAFRENQLLSTINYHNKKPLDIDIELLHGHWLPYRYDSSSQLVSWCMPSSSANDPFHADFITRSRRENPINQLIVPKTSIAKFQEQKMTYGTKPSGFIFHLSRCGSTLISGAISELNGASVLSESEILTDVMLDSRIKDSTKASLLSSLIDYQSQPWPKRRNAIVKWNAWDICQWPLILSAFPDTPIILIIRDPEAIVSSHERLSGRHMAGDPSLDKVLNHSSREYESLKEYRQATLEILMREMLELSKVIGGGVIDYSHVTPTLILQLAREFGLNTDRDDYIRIVERAKHYSKDLKKSFKSTSNAQSLHLRPNEKTVKTRSLRLLYQTLRNRASLTLSTKRPINRALQQNYR